MSRLQRSFVTIVRQILEDEEITQRELADRIGRSEPWVSRLLRDDHNVTLKTAQRIAVALGQELTFEWGPLPFEPTCEHPDTCGGPFRQPICAPCIAYAEEHVW